MERPIRNAAKALIMKGEKMLAIKIRPGNNRSDDTGKVRNGVF